MQLKSLSIKSLQENLSEIKMKKSEWIILVSVLTANACYSSQYPDENAEKYPDNIFWGDMHVHTNQSFDANGMGNQLAPNEAYLFAKGFPVTASNGRKVSLRRPLDFLVIADHGGNLGVLPALRKDDHKVLSTRSGKYWLRKFLDSSIDYESVLSGDDEESYDKAIDSIFHGGKGSYFWNMLSEYHVDDESFRESIWEKVTEAADKHNTPGVFTAFSGYEWTASYTAAIHRVVIFKDSSKLVSQVLPFTTFDSIKPEDLWSYMAGYEEKTGGEVLAIPHNSNISNGVTFALVDSDGRSLSKGYASLRQRWEPLVEITQIKGDSETHPLLSPDDEFSDYETWNSWKGWSLDGIEMTGWSSKKPYEYVRSALLNGLSEQSKLEVNPFKFGVIGSTDSHTSLATADEDNFWGKHVFSLPGKKRLFTKNEQAFLSKSWEYAASGYSAIWAEENTRESLFSAMKRKEVYATTGPRVRVRFFGGWDYNEKDAFKPDLARIGYDKGVPMGSDLSNAPKGKSPTFLIRAVKDPDGANLDRIQLIKGWHDANGNLHEKVYNVALSDNRKDSGNKTRPVGNTVDIPDASYTNTIGDPELAVVWKDPDFDARELAFYYVRVLEIPTPRWTAYDAKYFQLKDIPQEIPMITQDRAYTSPIWYTP